MSDMAACASCSDGEVYLSASEDEESSQQDATPELLAALVKQVEFYFSDANLPTDKKLLKQIRKDPLGYVPVKLFSNFRKVRALSKDVAVIAEALRGSMLLDLSPDGKRVRRVVPVPEYDIADIQRRTIVVENLPGSPTPTIESVTEVFRAYGTVKLVRICSRDANKSKLPSWLTSSCQDMAGQQHAYVEFEEEEGAVLAAAALAADADAPEGSVQARRLIACIAEQRDRRSGGGAGGSTYGASRRGSRDVSPLGIRGGSCSRRGSGGGAPHGFFSGGSFSGNSPRHISGSLTSGSYGGAAGQWMPTSQGGAATESTWRHPPSPYSRSYGGAIDSRRGSGGGCGFAPPPPPPPPPRSNADPTELATASGAPPSPALSGQVPRVNVYRPPSKRLSDGYTTLSGSASAGGAPPPVLQRSCGGSFNSSCGGSFNSSNGGSFNNSHFNSSGFGTSAASTPTAIAVCPFSPVRVPPPPPPPPSALPTAVPSPPMAARSLKPPSQPPLPMPYAVPVTNASALAEAIAATKAERRASEAGSGMSTPLAMPSAERAAVPMAASSAPKPCSLMYARSRSAGGAGWDENDECEEVVGSPRSVLAGISAVATTAAAARGTQMVANVEDFLNGILPPPPPPPPRSVASPSTSAATSCFLRPVNEDEGEDEAIRGSVPIGPSMSDLDSESEHTVSLRVRRGPPRSGGRKAYRWSTAPGLLPTIPSADISEEVCSALSSPPASPPRQLVEPAVRTAVPYARSYSAGGASANGNATAQHSPSHHQGGKHGRGRRDYAQWAAATPGFRAEATAASKHGATGSAGGAAAASGGLARVSGSFGGGVPTPSSLSDAGTAPPSPVPTSHAIVHVARGPDGSRGFAGRRAMVV